MAVKGLNVTFMQLKQATATNSGPIQRPETHSTPSATGESRSPLSQPPNVAIQRYIADNSRFASRLLPVYDWPKMNMSWVG